MLSLETKLGWKKCVSQKNVLGSVSTGCCLFKEWYRCGRQWKCLQLLLFYKDHTKCPEDLCVLLLISLVVGWRVRELTNPLCFVYHSIKLPLSHLRVKSEMVSVPLEKLFTYIFKIFHSILTVLNFFLQANEILLRFKKCSSNMF